mmetsp:Transcript_118891/g.341513  ORF Transcript_118891/g.341513 Transcript_118891/m.341513 type:complete len:267 (+) Transcript_118891:349-1149(+)
MELARGLRASAVRWRHHHRRERRHAEQRTRRCDPLDGHGGRDHECRRWCVLPHRARLRSEVAPAGRHRPLHRQVAGGEAAGHGLRRDVQQAGENREGGRAPHRDTDGGRPGLCRRGLAQRGGPGGVLQHRLRHCVLRDVRGSVVGHGGQRDLLRGVLHRGRHVRRRLAQVAEQEPTGLDGDFRRVFVRPRWRGEVPAVSASAADHLPRPHAALPRRPPHRRLAPGDAHELLPRRRRLHLATRRGRLHGVARVDECCGLGARAPVER